MSADSLGKSTNSSNTLEAFKGFPGSRQRVSLCDICKMGCPVQRNLRKTPHLHAPLTRTGMKSWPKSLTLALWSEDWHPGHLHGTHWKCRLSGPAPGPPSQNQHVNGTPRGLLCTSHCRSVGPQALAWLGLTHLSAPFQHPPSLSSSTRSLSFLLTLSPPPTIPSACHSQHLHLLLLLLQGDLF